MKGPGLHNIDCMEALREYPDKYFALAIVDPPYGDAESGGNPERFGQRFDKYKKPCEIAQGGGYHGKCQHGNFEDRRDVGREIRKKIIAWDVAPGADYFTELFRVSRNQIIWGGNYFRLPPCRCFIVWRKTNIPAQGFSMAPVEYAWTSFRRNAEYIEASSAGRPGDPRFHPTQKPVELYEDLLRLFAKPGDNILDTHTGSGSSMIACYNMHYDFTGFEIDGEYYTKALERYEEHTAQLRLF